jgi:integrase/recombinase XerD
MPPRKRPKTEFSLSTNSIAGPSSHLPAFVRYLESECGMAKNTVKAYQSDLRRFMEWYSHSGTPRVADITLGHLGDFLQFLYDQNLAASTVGRNLVSLKMFFRYLVLEGVLRESKVELLSSPKLWQRLPKVLSPEMVNSLLSAPGPDDRFPNRDRAILTVLYATGCRASEITGLKTKDVFLEEGYCRCLGKGDKERMVSLNPVAVSAINDYLKHERPLLTVRGPENAIFVTRRGNPLSRIMIWNIVKKYAARIGCSKEVSPHTLRHSFATHMLAGGAEIRALQELLGHASIATTQIYTHVEHSRLKAVHQQCHPRG